MLLESKVCLVTLFFGECGSRIHGIVPEFKVTSGILQLASRLPLVTSLQSVGARCLQTCLTLQQAGSCKDGSWSSPLLEAVSTKADGMAGGL